MLFEKSANEDITEELLNIDLSPPQLRRQYGRINLLIYSRLNFKNKLINEPTYTNFKNNKSENNLCIMLNNYNDVKIKKNNSY